MYFYVLGYRVQAMRKTPEKGPDQIISSRKYGLGNQMSFFHAAPAIIRTCLLEMSNAFRGSRKN